jgi:glycosyltransferase involved in cell wall biosynthesis
MDQLRGASRCNSTVLTSQFGWFFYMRIAYDHQIFALQSYGGISRYFYNLAQQLSPQDHIQLGIIAPMYINAYLKSSNSLNIRGFAAPMMPKAQRLSAEISSLFSPLGMHVFRPDVVHETEYRLHTCAIKRAARVVTVHDMIHEIYPALFPGSDAKRMTRAKKAAVDRADFVICVSEHTRQDLIKWFGVDPAKTVTVYHGYDMTGNKSVVEAAVDRTARSTAASTKPYLLYVGARLGYKNFTNLLKAYGNSTWLPQAVNLLCFGGGRFTVEETGLMAELGLSEAQVQQVSGGDAALAEAYQGAAALVYPSLYEGFGMPLLEAMFWDCPVICSHTSSIPEVAGAAAEYFDPTVWETIAAAIERVLHSHHRRTELMQLGRQRYPQFSWAKCAAETLAVYHKVV